MKKARDTDNKMIAFSIFCCVGMVYDTSYNGACFP